MSSPDSSGVTESIANLSITTTDAPQELFEETEEQITPRQSQFPAISQQPETSSKRKRGESNEDSSNSGSDTETETANSNSTTTNSTKMPSGSSSKHHSSSSSSSKKHHSSSSSSSKHHTKSDDWSDVTEPEERRRIQNRIAQRKFREKTREQKERHEREARNQELAGSSYAVPLAADLSGGSISGGGSDAYGAGDHLSGLPWGGLNIPHMVARGHESVSQQGSRRGASDQYQNSQQQHQHQHQHQQQGGYYDPQLWSGNMGYDATDDRYFDTSASSSSPSYFSYDAFSGDGTSQ